MGKKAAIERFMEKVRKDPKTGCWLWTGTASRPNGYGQFRAGGRRYSAHRWAYMTLSGEPQQRFYTY